MLIQIFLFLVVLNLSYSLDFTYYVEDGKSPGAFVGDIAYDTHVLDSLLPQDRKLVRFSQMREETIGTSQLFRVSRNTGKIYTAQALDAESICVRNEECFKIVDVAVRKRETFIKILEIKVIIQDANDHQPEFPEKEVSIQFSENDAKGTKVSIPNAIDGDVGILNSQITYQLEKNKYEPFALSVSKSLDGTSKLSITLEERLDREVKDSYIVQVIAKDGGSPPKQSVLDVHIAVTDVNDTPPVFSQNVYNVSVKNEHEKTFPIVILSATDADLEQNGKVSYRFSSQTSNIAKSLFDLDESTGEIFLGKDFTFGQKLIYKLYVEATDEGNPPLSSTAKVVVYVINQQNNPPVIDVNFVSASTGNTATISEDIAVGSFIAYVKVSDHDFGLNGEVICDLHHNKFQLQSLGTKKFKVIVKDALDRETRDHHDITIICKDKGTPSLQSESKFSIKIMDVNDVRPQFTERTFKFVVDENQRSKFPVGFINATDPDLGLGGQLTYSLLTDHQDFLPFQITDNGQILTLVSLDHEFQDVYKFQVFVKDNGKPPLNSTVKIIVEVKDENDNTPYFTFPSVNPYSLDVTYYPRHTKNITFLKAFDRDSRENAFLKYEILKGNDKQLFTLNHYSGLLSFSRDLNQQDAGAYDLQFIVKDNGIPILNATTTVFLTLTVSNKTIGILNTALSQPEDKVNMFILIVIVLVAVTVSVPVTASVSICFIRCKNRKNGSLSAGANPCAKHISEERHLMCPSHLDSSWADVPGDRTTELDTVRSSHQTKSRRGIYPRDQLDISQKNSTSGTKTYKAKDIIYQARPTQDFANHNRSGLCLKTSPVHEIQTPFPGV